MCKGSLPGAAVELKGANLVSDDVQNHWTAARIRGDDQMTSGVEDRPLRAPVPE